MEEELEVDRLPWHERNNAGDTPWHMACLNYMKDFKNLVLRWEETAVRLKESRGAQTLLALRSILIKKGYSGPSLDQIGLGIQEATNWKNHQKWMDGAKGRGGGGKGGGGGGKGGGGRGNRGGGGGKVGGGYGKKGGGGGGGRVFR